MEQQGPDWIGQFLSWLENSPPAAAIAASDWAFPIIEAIHVIALALVIGTVCIVDLRLLGWASTQRPYAEVARETLPVTWLAFVVAATTGTLMFVSKATAYAGNGAFRVKAILLLFVGLNMLIFELATARRSEQWDCARPIPWSGKLAGALSLLFWISIVFFGRRVGFTMTPD